MSIELSDHAPRRIRDEIEAAYVDVVERSVLDDMVIMASEVTTNAVLHSGRPIGDPITLTTRIGEGTLRVEITDGGPGTATLTPRSLVPPSGLGFVEILSDRWGCRRNGAFHVWFEIDLVQTPPRSTHDGPGSPATREIRRRCA